jgi:hypothetical protein
MRDVARRRGLPADGHLITLAEAELVGQTVYARPTSSAEWESFRVVDCAGKHDRQSETDDRSGYEWMQTSGIVAELQWETWEAWRAQDADLLDGVTMHVFIPLEVRTQIVPE